MELIQTCWQALAQRFQGGIRRSRSRVRNPGSLPPSNETEISLQQENEALRQALQQQTYLLQQATQFESMLKRITDKVRESLDEGQILQTAVRELASGLQVESCEAYIYNPTRTTATLCYEYSRSLPSIQGQMMPMDAMPDIYRELLQARSVKYCSIIRHPLRSRYRRFAMLVCPIVGTDGVLGDVWLYKPATEIFTETEIRLVNQVVNQGAIALRQARLYQAAQHQVEELERLARLKDDFLSTVSHEMRTPMSSIKMAVQMLEILLFRNIQQQENLSGSIEISSTTLQRTSRYFSILQTECEREINLINDLLDLSKLDAGEVLLTISEVDVEDWLVEFLQPFTTKIDQQQQTFVLELPEQLPRLQTDLPKLERILKELLENACKYTPAQNSITMALIQKPEVIQFQVKNSGVNIPALELPYIFEKFHRIPSDDPWKYGGTGLGLALVEKLVEKLGGRIRVTSITDEIQFTVELPWQLRTILESPEMESTSEF
ncbi:MAG: GAF domain-containing sensor histidine kinase [Synechococcales bacterium]|nr:GAF domain-containing sensor histidine kinase [Synechococcales bacterium]